MLQQKQTLQPIFLRLSRTKKCYITLATPALNAETNGLAYSPKIVKIARTKIMFTIELNVVPKQTLQLFLPRTYKRTTMTLASGSLHFASKTNTLAYSPHIIKNTVMKLYEHYFFLPHCQRQRKEFIKNATLNIDI